MSPRVFVLAACLGCAPPPPPAVPPPPASAHVLSREPEGYFCVAEGGGRALVWRRGRYDIIPSFKCEFVEDERTLSEAVKSAAEEKRATEEAEALIRALGGTVDGDGDAGAD